MAKLQACLSISDADQEWLDGDGNLIDEEQVLEILEKASDYERGLEKLNFAEKMIVQRLEQLAQGAAPSKSSKKSKISIKLTVKFCASH
jgi:hypothetical protein